MSKAVPPRVPLPRAYWVLWSGTLVNRAGTFVEPFAVLYLTSQRGFSPSQVGIALVAYGAGAAVSQIVGGWAADHVGRRSTLVWGMTAAGLSLALLGAARGLAPICAAAFLVGLASDVYRPASNALVTDLVGPGERRRAFALLFWAVNLGFSLAAVAAGFVAGISYALLFAIDAATCLGFAGVVFVGIRKDPPRPPPANADRPAGYGTALRDPVMLALVALTVLEATVYFQNAITLPLAVTHNGLRPRDFGLILAVNGVLIVAAQPVAVRLLHRYDRLRVLAAGSALVGVGFWLTLFAGSVPAYMGTVVVWTLGEIATAGLVGSLVADLAPPEARGRYAAVWGSSFGLATLFAPLFGTWTYQYLGPVTLWTACLVVGLLVAAGFVALGPPVRRRTAGLSAASFTDGANDGGGDG
jgi:MFS family permease